MPFITGQNFLSVEGSLSRFARIGSRALERRS